MTDKEFLRWIAALLVHVYGESPNVDFVKRLEEIAEKGPDLPSGHYVLRMERWMDIEPAQETLYQASFKPPSSFKLVPHTDFTPLPPWELSLY